MEDKEVKLNKENDLRLALSPLHLFMKSLDENKPNELIPIKEESYGT